MLAHDQILAGSASIMVAGGMESMSRAPYLLDKARAGLRLGHGRTLDHMFLDGLEDAYEPGRLMGSFAEDTAEKLQFTRQAQDQFALESLSRARRATQEGAFHAEIVTVADTSDDETPTKARPEKIPTLKPAFREGGTVTAANSSSISDGAAALVLMRLSEAERRGLTPLAAIRGHASHAHLPAWFTTAPIGAISKLCERLEWSQTDVDLFEINEAFAVVTMAAMRELDLPHDKVNVNGGACALGHPIGASGARILVTPAGGPGSARHAARHRRALHRRRRGHGGSRRAAELKPGFGGSAYTPIPAILSTFNTAAPASLPSAHPGADEGQAPAPPGSSAQSGVVSVSDSTTCGLTPGAETRSATFRSSSLKPPCSASFDPPVQITP